MTERACEVRLKSAAPTCQTPRLHASIMFRIPAFALAGRVEVTDLRKLSKPEPRQLAGARHGIPAGLQDQVAPAERLGTQMTFLWVQMTC